MKIRMEPLDQADLDRLTTVLDSDRPTLEWLARHPSGPGVAITAWRGESPAGGVIAIPGVHSASGSTHPITRLVLGRIDHPDAAPALADRCALELEHSSVLSLFSRLPERLERRLDAADLPTPKIWVTGPDPFVPTQPDVVEFDHTFDDLATRLLSSKNYRLHRDAATWAWRYQGHPNRDYRLMHIRRNGRVEGLIAARIATVQGARTIVVLELSATDDDVTYALLKSVRRWSWEEGSLPVTLLDAGLARWFAFTAGYVALPSQTTKRRRGAAAHRAPGPWQLHEADWLRY